jgi:hypothetical protein
MTQVATPATVLGAWDGVKLEVEGRSVELSRRGDELWVTLPDPDRVAQSSARGAAPSPQIPLVSRHVVLATGSHHQQVYWVRGERGNELRLVPISYLIAEKRYVARRDAFLQPPDAPPHAIRWNSNCIQCHATRGAPELDETSDRFASSATELGIACEACHGPGAAHVRKQQNPLTRFTSRLNDAADPSIVNPARLSPERASEVCGQCHAYFVPRDEDRWWRTGFEDYRPGDALSATRTLLSFGSSDVNIEASTESLFWGDGTIRVGGREWNGLRASACFLRGTEERQISCLSCHSLHDSEADDQLRHGQSADAPCERCHVEQTARRAEHTHHAAGSPGSACVNCHMPFTSYALFTALRSHRIDSPSALTTASTGRPNACNLCHLDRTLAWTAATLAAWQGRAVSAGVAAPASLASPTSRAVEELLSGDAATRAVAAAAFGNATALQASGSTWEAGVLAELTADPYAAVRHVACASLATLPGFARFDCNFTADRAEREVIRARVLSHFSAPPAARSNPALPFDARGQRDEARVRALLDARDQRPISISE